MPRGWDYPDSKLVHGVLSLLQELGQLLSHRVSFRVDRAPFNNKGWKYCYLFVSGPNWGFKLDWSAHPIGNVPPYLSEEESVLVGRLKGILFSSCAIKEMIELWLVEVGLSPASRGADWMDLDDLRGMPRASGGKTPTAHSTISTQETGEGPPIEAPRPSSKRSSDAPVQPDDLAQRHKEVKILSRMHKSCHGEGGSQSHSKGKEPAVSVEEPEGQAESLDKAGTSVFVHPKSMKDL
ncbi:hypothetical protein BHM03_00007353 [Ensete ventricosum]|nr:hypothetical protein BHM03_00007353 [Ensete ventricosum]